MNKSTFIKTIKIEDTSVLGDHWHNNQIDYYLDGIVQSHTSRKIQDYIVAVMGTGSQRWIFRVFSKGDFRWLNSICKAKTLKTRKKRMDAYIAHQYKPHYGGLFNKTKIEKFLEMMV